MMNGILTSIKNVDKLHHIYVYTKDILTRAYIHAEYKATNIRTNDLTFCSKKQYYSKYINEYSNNIKKVKTKIHPTVQKIKMN